MLRWLSKSLRIEMPTAMKLALCTRPWNPRDIHQSMTVAENPQAMNLRIVIRKAIRRLLNIVKQCDVESAIRRRIAHPARVVAHVCTSQATGHA